MKKTIEVLHELFVLGSPYSAVGINNSRLPNCLAPHIFFPILISKCAIDFQTAASGRGIKAGYRGSVIIFVRVC